MVFCNMSPIPKEWLEIVSYSWTVCLLDSWVAAGVGVVVADAAVTAAFRVRCFLPSWPVHWPF